MATERTFTRRLFLFLAVVFCVVWVPTFFLARGAGVFRFVVANTVLVVALLVLQIPPVRRWCVALLDYGDA